MGDVEQLLGSALDRFERLKDQEGAAEKQYDKIDALFSLLQDEYREETASLHRRVEALQQRIDEVEDDADNVAERLPGLARSEPFESLRRDVKAADFSDCVTRDEFARKYC